MTNVTEERALRDAMHDVVADQPQQPMDRIAGVRRRHVRRRTGQAIGAAMAVVALVAGSLSLRTAPEDSTPEPLDRPVPSWALPWPDHRDGSVPQRVLDGAIEAWRYQGSDTTGPLPEPSKVIWYVGQLVADTNVVVMFEVDGVTGQRLVAGQASASSVLDGPAFEPQTGFSPWVLYDVPTPSFPTTVGLNVPGNTSPFTNWIVVLSDPRNTTLGWSAPGTDGGTAPLEKGFAVVNTGVVRGRVSVVLGNPETPYQAGPVSPVVVGVPGAPDSQSTQLAEVPKLKLSPGEELTEASGQGSVVAEFNAATTLPTVLVGRCYGDGVVHVRLGGGPFAANIPCDDREHQIDGPRLSTAARSHKLSVDASRFTAYRVAVFQRTLTN